MLSLCPSTQNLFSGFGFTDAYTYVKTPALPFILIIIYKAGVDSPTRFTNLLFVRVRFGLPRVKL